MGKKNNFVLLLSYFIIGLPILFFHLNMFNLTYELLLIPFIVNMLIYWLFRIDSRYIILNAILFLWLCPFLLVYKYDTAAESFAIYAYYSLLTGVLLQIWETWLDYKIRVSLRLFKKIFFRKTTLTLGIIWGSTFFIAQLINLRNSVKVLSLYLSITLLIFYFLKFIITEDSSSGKEHHEDEEYDEEEATKEKKPIKKPKAYRFI